MDERIQFVGFDQARTHPVLDLDEVDRVIPLESVPPYCDSVMGPRDYVALRRARKGVVSDGDASRPMDMFLWAEGVDAPSWVSRLGGVPHMPRDERWPSLDGMAAQFWCQLCMSDSRDLVGDTPGDVLLVFRHHNVLACEPEAFEFRWSERLTVEAALGPESVPAGTCRSRSLVGVRVREFDYHGDRVCGGGEPRIAPAIKLGGFPLDWQDLDWIEAPRGTRYLGQVVSVSPRAGEYPLIGRREPIAHTGEFREYGFCEAALSVALFMASDGRIETRTSLS